MSSMLDMVQEANDPRAFTQACRAVRSHIEASNGIDPEMTRSLLWSIAMKGHVLHVNAPWDSGPRVKTGYSQWVLWVLEADPAREGSTP